MLQISDLAYRYPGSKQPSLDGVSLSVYRGQLVGLLGPNGAGKTTLISHLSGLLPLQKGTITVDDLPLAKARRADPTRIAIAPQEYAFYPVLTVDENLSCFASASGLSGRYKSKRVETSIAATQLASHRGVRAQHLSGGLKRRLNLAIALLPEPDFLLLDEPTVGVDPQSRAFLLSTIQQLAAAGMGVIYTSHYMEEIEALAQEVTIIDHGKVLIQGRLDALLNTDAAKTRVTLALANPPENAATILAAYGDVAVTGDGFDVLLRPEVLPTTLFSALSEAGISISHAQFGRQNLENLFMALTHRTLRD